MEKLDPGQQIPHAPTHPISRKPRGARTKINSQSICGFRLSAAASSMATESFIGFPKKSLGQFAMLPNRSSSSSRIELWSPSCWQKPECKIVRCEGDATTQ